MMKNIIEKLLITVCLLLPAIGSAQTGDDFFTVTHVAGNVHMLEAPESDGNIGVFSGPDGVLLIDDRYDRDTEHLLTAVRSISDSPIRFVVNTHVHPDHIGGNNNLAAYGITILAHDDVRLRMLTELRIPRRGGIIFPQPPPGALPVITYSDAISFHLNGEEVRVFLAPPAHTDGDSFVHFRGSDVLHLGDVFRTNMYPIIDVYNGGSFLGMIAAMELAIELAGPDTKVIPGHGSGVSDREGMQEVLALLYDIRDRVAALIDQGLSLEQTMAAAPSAPHDERWGQVPSWTAADFIPIVYAELLALNPRVENVLLENVRVIVGDGSVIPDAAVLLQDDRIVAVGASAELEIPVNAQRIDLMGKTLMPAMIDAHAHLGYDAFNSWGAQNYTVENLIDHLNRYAFYGFGAVFSAGSDPDTLALQLQKSQEDGETGGARFLFAAGMAPPGQGPNNQFLVEAIAVEQHTGNTILRGLASPDLARIAVREVADRQIGFIKLWVDDRGGSQEKLAPDIYRAAIAEANRLGLAAVVHQQYAEDMPDLIAAGTRGFLHGRLESGFTPAIAEAAGVNDVFIVPNLGLGELRREAIGDDEFLAQTLPASAIQRLSASTARLPIPDRDPQLEQTLRNSFSYMMAANVDVVLGTDAGAVPDHPFGYTGHRELEIFVKYGMTPMQALSAATSVAAKVLGLEDAGLVKAGYRADLLVLDQNPLEDIRNTRRIHAVYLGGKQLDRAALAAGFNSEVVQENSKRESRDDIAR